MNKEDVIVLPGTIQFARNYGYEGLDIWIRDCKVVPSAKIYIGHSLGASFILKLDENFNKKFILINPLIKKRNFFVHFVNWIRFLVFEGFNIKKAVPVRCWMHTFKQVLLLLKVDVLEQMKKIPSENIIVIKGKYDNYFCDKENLEILKLNNFNVIEVEAGHDWNENVAKNVAEIIEK